MLSENAIFLVLMMTLVTIMKSNVLHKILQMRGFFLVSGGQRVKHIMDYQTILIEYQFKMGFNCKICMNNIYITKQCWL